MVANHQAISFKSPFIVNNRIFAPNNYKLTWIVTTLKLQESR